MDFDKLPLKKWRQIRGLTQTQLADAVGLTANTISNFENKEGAIEKTSYENLNLIAQALEIEVDNIFLNHSWIKSK